MTCSEIIQGNFEAHGAVVLQGMLKYRPVLNGLSFRDFDNDAVRVEFVVLQIHESSSMNKFVIGQRYGIYIDEEVSRKTEFGELPDDQLAAQEIQFREASVLGRSGEQNVRPM